ncbi:MAG: aldo/keto reductase [Acidobacteria bacterium]|nr:MAG: aldo/keto reductase [Acidobacteriota bacterium]
MNHIYGRREFVRTAVAGAGSLLAAGGFSGVSAAPSPAKAGDLVTLGSTGIKASLLAQGTGFNGSARSSEHTRLGLQAFDSLVRHSFDKGINFMDAADLYGSHPFLRDALKGIPREKYVLLSKIWPRQESWNAASGGANQEVDRFRKELATDTIDICLIHCMTDSNWPQTFARVRDELSGLKQKGVVRSVGVSCHDLGALKVAASDPWVDVILARINYQGGGRYSMDGTADEVSQVLKSARKSGKAVVGMKIFGAGRLVQPEEKDASLKYVLGNGLVDAMTIGMLTPAQVDDTTDRIARALRA